MTKKEEKRNSLTRIDSQGSLFDGPGGRQGQVTQSDRGGGYQNICTVLNFDKKNGQKNCDPRLDELNQMGLQRVWLVIAEQIGVDNMLMLWRIIDSDQSSIGDDGRLLVPIRSYSTYLRYQRNRYIESLNNMGLTPPEIQKKLKDQLCEQISIRHISRLIQQD